MRRGAAAGSSAAGDGGAGPSSTGGAGDSACVTVVPPTAALPPPAPSAGASIVAVAAACGCDCASMSSAMSSSVPSIFWSACVTAAKPSTSTVVVAGPRAAISACVRASVRRRLAAWATSASHASPVSASAWCSAMTSDFSVRRRLAGRALAGVVVVVGVGVFATPPPTFSFRRFSWSRSARLSLRWLTGPKTPSASSRCSAWNDFRAVSTVPSSFLRGLSRYGVPAFERRRDRRRVSRTTSAPRAPTLSGPASVDTTTGAAPSSTSRQRAALASRSWLYFTAAGPLPL